MSKAIILDERTIAALQAAGIETETGIIYTGSVEKYAMALQTFSAGYGAHSYALCEACRELQERGLIKEVVAQLTNEAHALKGNARMIGAGELAQQAEAMEFLGRRNDLEGIAREKENLLAEYKRVVEALSPRTEEDEEQTPETLSRAAAQSLLDEILVALAEFDDDLAANLTKRLMAGRQGESLREELAKLDEYIDDFLYDEAETLVRQIKEQLDK